MNRKIKIDLHSHSILSYDGGISQTEYANALESELLDQIAITDHNEIQFALDLANKFPKKIIVGEEISTVDGDLIGLFLTELIPRGKSLEETAELIKNQGGIIYVPHPFDTIRGGISHKMERIKHVIDIVEGFNARDIANTSDRAKKYAIDNRIPWCAGSDSHGSSELGKTYTIIDEMADRDNIVDLIKEAKGEFTLEKRVGVGGFLNPLRNKIMKKLSHG